MRLLPIPFLLQDLPMGRSKKAAARFIIKTFNEGNTTTPLRERNLPALWQIRNKEAFPGKLGSRSPTDGDVAHPEWKAPLQLVLESGASPAPSSCVLPVLRAS